MATYKATWPSGITLSWRDMTWQEYEYICGTRDMTDYIPPEICVAICRVCILEGPAESMITAGAGNFIAQQQVTNNPFSGDAKALILALNNARDIVNNDYLLSAQAMIAHVFDYKIEELRSWTPSKFFLRVAQAEVIVGQHLNPAVPQSTTVANPVLPSKVPSRTLTRKQYREQKNSS